MVIDLEKIIIDEEKKLINPENNLVKKLINKLRSVSSIPNKDIIFLFQNLQVMIKSGLALDKSLKTLSLQTNNYRLKSILNDLTEKTESGISFYESLKKYEKVFGAPAINMIKAGEVSGRLEDVLKQIFLQAKKSYELKSRVKAALVYPIIVVVAMIGIAIAMFIFVIPKITSLFDQVQAQLPLATKILITISNFSLRNGPLVLLLITIILILISFSFKHKKTKYFYHQIFLKLPIFGEIIKKINLAKFSRTISSLIKTDIPIIKTLTITSDVVTNLVYKKALKESAENVKSGASLTDILGKYSNLFPPVIIQMVSAGEETGSLDTILDELATFYEEEIDQIMKTLPSIIEPILILILGIGVGAMAVAIIMPMYSLT